MTYSLSRREFMKSAAIGAASFCLSPTIFIPKARAEVVPGEIQLQNTNGWNWWSYVPLDLDPGQIANILVTTIGFTEDYVEQTEYAKMHLEWNIEATRNLKMVNISVAVPRGMIVEHYVNAYPRAVLDGTNEPFYSDPHLKITDCLDIIIDDLDLKGFNVNPKIYFEGFSNGGFSSQRYALLLPERVRAIAGGGMAGSFVLPLSIYNAPSSPNNGKTLHWSLGVNDLESLAGKLFDEIEYKKVNQYIFHGSEDNKPEHTIVRTSDHPINGPSEIYSDEDAEFVIAEFGKTDPERMQNTIDYIRGQGFSNVEFHLEEGYGHEYTHEMKMKVIAFFSQYMDIPEQQPNEPPDDPPTDPPDETDNGSSGGGGGCFIKSLG